MLHTLNDFSVYSLLKVLATKSSVLDTYLKPKVSQNVKAADKELHVGSIQSAVLDAMAPLTSIVEADAKDAMAPHILMPKVTMSPINRLLMQQRQPFNCECQYLRTTKIISQMNKALLPLTEEDQNFVDAAPALFGSAFAQKSKEWWIR